MKPLMLIRNLYFSDNM